MLSMFLLIFCDLSSTLVDNDAIHTNDYLSQFIEGVDEFLDGIRNSNKSHLESKAWGHTYTHLYKSVFWAPVYPLLKFPYVQNGRFLEIGSGIGVWSVEAALKGMKVTACDINPDAIENTKYNANQFGVYDHFEGFYVCDVFDNVPLPPNDDDKYDIIFWNFPWIYRAPDDDYTESDYLDAAHYDIGYQNLQKYLKNAHKYLKPNGGKFYIEFGDGQLGGNVGLLKHFANENDCKLDLFDETTDHEFIVPGSVQIWELTPLETCT
eukprot:33867_1